MNETGYIFKTMPLLNILSPNKKGVMLSPELDEGSKHFARARARKRSFEDLRMTECCDCCIW